MTYICTRKTKRKLKEGTKRPLFFYKMDYKKIENIVREVLVDEESFLVELTVGANNKIVIRADSFEGMKMSRLKMINRKIEGLLDREIEDFDLTISSPGVDKPLLVFDQYLLNKGRLVAIKVVDTPDPIKGRLTEVSKDQIVITTKGSKKEVSKEIQISFSDIEETKIEIEF